jgi:hypothetical protein
MKTLVARMTRSAKQQYAWHLSFLSRAQKRNPLRTYPRSNPTVASPRRLRTTVSLLRDRERLVTRRTGSGSRLRWRPKCGDSSECGPERAVGLGRVRTASCLKVLEGASSFSCLACPFGLACRCSGDCSTPCRCLVSCATIMTLSSLPSMCVHLFLSN